MAVVHAAERQARAPHCGLLARLLLRPTQMAVPDRISPIPSSPPSSPIAPGEVIQGRYRVGHVIGEGGMGVVLEAMHLGLEVPVALKIIRSDLKADEEFVLRFLNEARAAALLKGEHVARVYDVGQLETGEPFLVMEKLEGVCLETFLDTVGALEPSEAVRVVLEVCEGLAEAHAHALVHRDIKPANLFLARRTDGSSIVKILDFGIAKRLAGRGQRSLTNPARSLGSPWYMSPEQMMDPSRVNARTDIWSLGVLLFELLTADHPFDGDGVPEVCARVMNAPAPSLFDYRKDVDRALDAVVQRCLEKDLERRFPSVAALAESLLECSPVPHSSVRALTASRRGRTPSRTTFGSLAPLADQLGLRPTPWSGVLAGAGAFAVAGAVTWALTVYAPTRGVPPISWPKLERLAAAGRSPALAGADRRPALSRAEGRLAAGHARARARGHGRRRSRQAKR